MSERKGLICTAIAVSLVGIVTGLFLGGGLLPFQAANQLYNESTATSKTVRTVVHSHDGISQHEHTIIIVVTTTETTPHGYFHNFAATSPPAQQGPVTPEITLTPAPPPDQQGPITPGVTPAHEPPPAQQGPVTPEIAPTPIPTPKPTQGVNEIWMFAREYIPASITVPVGTTVTWINKDGEMHIARGDNDLFNGNVLPGRSFSYTFTENGTFNYFCEAHNIGGTVIVR